MFCVNRDPTVIPVQLELLMFPEAFDVPLRKIVELVVLKYWEYTVGVAVTISVVSVSVSPAKIR